MSSISKLTYIGLLRIVVSFTIFKTCLLGRGFHTLIKNVLFPSPTDMGSHNPPFLARQRANEDAEP